MATITATKAGNWSDTSVWDLGRVPQAGDDVALAGYVIVWDTSITRIPASGTLTSISSTGTAGQITLALDNAAFHGGASLYATTITAGTLDFNGTIRITGTTDHVLTIYTGTSAGEGIIGGTTSNDNCVVNASSGTCNIIGNIKGGGSVIGSTSHGVENASTGTINVTGSVTGGLNTSCLGIKNSSTGTINVTGTVIGGTGQYAHGLYNYVGGVAFVDGIITGGSGPGAMGVYNNQDGQVTLSSTSSLINGTKGVAYGGKPPAWQPLSTTYLKWYVGASFGQAANTEFPQVLSAANIKAGVTSGSVTGTLVGGMPRFGGRSGGK